MFFSVNTAHHLYSLQDDNNGSNTSTESVSNSESGDDLIPCDLGTRKAKKVHVLLRCICSTF